MKILFLCHRVPYPPKRGGKISPFNIIRHFGERGHEVTVASLARDREELQEATELGRFCKRTIVEIIPNWKAWLRMILWLPTKKSSSFAYFFSPVLQRRIAEELRNNSFDMIFVHCSSMADYVVGVQGIFKVLDYCDVDSQKWREYSTYRSFPLSLGFSLEASKVENAERRLGALFDFVTCTTRAELESLRALGVTTRSGWFPHGVDTEYFAPSPQAYDPNLLVFVGRMDYFPNQQAVVEFCKRVLPMLRQQLPDARFCIVGADPPQHIRDLAKLPGVSVTGSVVDVRPYVTNAALTVAPLAIARGTQNKILESMAMGVPVVCSRQASGGVDAVAGEHLLVADTPAEYVAHVARLMKSPEFRQQLATAARERVLARHIWPKSMKRLDELLEPELSGRLSF